jgi:2-hydroxychromene-2-carboxylate isomerase
MNGDHPSIDFWFEYGSTYSYVAAMRIDQEATRRGVNVVWRPFLLGPIFTKLLGIKDSPFNVFPVRARYMWRDIERLCAKHRIPWRRPTKFPRTSVLAARVSLLASNEPWASEFARRVYAANFAEDREIGDREVILGILRSLNVDAEAWAARAESPEAKAALRAQNESAEALGIFGAPNFVSRGELFFGQDRIDDALDWATQSVG